MDLARQGTLAAPVVTNIANKLGWRGGEMLTTTDLTPNIGTEIKIDRQALLSGEHAAEIRRLLEARGVLVFRELYLTDEEQLTFAKTIGKTVKQGDDDVYKISLDERESGARMADILRASFYWHIDNTSFDVPNLATLLSAKRLSQTGGDTEFANTYAAYDALPDHEKKSLSSVRVVHSLVASQRCIHPEPSYAELLEWQSNGKKAHPMVWTHRSGRKSLVLGVTCDHVVGLSADEGYDLLCRLRDWATQPRFVYRHHWTLGDLVIWDNTGTMHRATPYPADSDRLMHRVVLAGEESLV